MTLAGPFSTCDRIEFTQATIKARMNHCGGKCEGCGAELSASNPPEADHHKEAWQGGDNNFENCRILGAKCCHRKKTAQNTTSRAKADRQSIEGHWLKQQKKSRNPIPGSRGTKWKRKVNGSIERRN